MEIFWGLWGIGNERPLKIISLLLFYYDLLTSVKNDYSVGVLNVNVQTKIRNVRCARCL